MKLTMRSMIASAVAALMMGGAASADVVKIGYIDPLSGPFATVGNSGLKHFQYLIDRINAAGGVAGGDTLEVIGFDNKVNPKEALVQFQKALDEGIQYITQGNGSSVGHALTEAVRKHNRRNPDNPVLYLNYAAVDPSLTNDECNYWHFRFDADGDMKMAALTDWLKSQEQIKKIYIIGQDYSFGKAVAAAAHSMLAEKRPDIEIVGDELHPLGKVKDFSPYIQKIINSGADAVITGNWGTDMTLLIKAAADAGHDVPYLTYYGGGLGAPTAMGRSAVGLVKQVSEFTENVETSEEVMEIMNEFEEKYDLDFYYFRVKTLLDMLKGAMDAAGSTEPGAVAAALEGMTMETPYGEVRMREDNHQLLQPLFISTFSDEVERDVEHTGFGFKTDQKIDGEATATETTCKMRRPG